MHESMANTVGIVKIKSTWKLWYLLLALLLGDFNKLFYIIYWSIGKDYPLRHGCEEVTVRGQIFFVFLSIVVFRWLIAIFAKERNRGWILYVIAVILFPWIIKYAANYLE